jgi:Phage major capsid protein E
MANFQTSPLLMDEYSRFMVDVFDERQLISVSTVFQSFFGRPENGSRTLFSPDAAAVDIDIIRGNERLAALIPRGVNARMLDKPDTTAQRFTNISRVYPLVEEEGNIDSNQLLFRRAGENPFDQNTRLTRMRGHALDIHQESIRRTVRLFEYLAAQSVLTGKMPAIMGTTDANKQYDFLRPGTHIITVATEWDKALSTPLADVDTACGLIRTDGHAMADMMILGSQAMDAFVNHATVKALADNLRFELIEVGRNPVPPSFQRFVEAGAIPRGRLRTPRGYELWLFTYLDVYTDASGDPQPYMPVDEVLIASSTARCDRYFGPGESLPNVPARDALYQELFGFSPSVPQIPALIKNAGAIVSPLMFYCDAYVSENWKRVTCRTQSAPIFATTQTDAFVTLNGLITV